MKTEEIKRTSDKKGISLIVLVITIIVIIILAVAVILSIANNNPIENAKEARFKSDIKTIEEDLNMYTLKKYADGKIKGIEEVNLSGDDMVSALPSTKNYKEKVEIKNGTLYIKSGDALTKDEQNWAKEVGVEKTPITFKKQGTEELAIGSEVTATNGESFYVIGFSDDKTKVNLLAKYNLKEENGILKQDTIGVGEKYAFCSEAAWNSANIADGDNLNSKKSIYSETTSVVGKAIEYGKTFIASGRLITMEEIENLGGNKSDYSLSGCPEFINTQTYWIGFARYGKDGGVSVVLGEGKTFITSDYRGRKQCSSSYRSTNIFGPINNFWL